MKLTLTREQIPLATRVAAWVNNPDVDMEDVGLSKGDPSDCPGYQMWCTSWSNEQWANALRAAIAEAEVKDADPRQPGPVSDADERAFWREAYLTGRAHAVTSMASTYQASAAADEADMALDRYRKAFCAGMPSDQKGSDR